MSIEKNSGDMKVSVFDLTGRVAIVTGGNRGIGFGVTRGLLAVGASVVIASRDLKKSVEALKKLKVYQNRISSIETDVTKPESIRRMIRFALKSFKRIDILVANAGINNRKFPEEFGVNEWKAILDVNLTGTFLCAQAAYPAMKKTGGGKIITVGSMTSFFGAPGMAPYSASKGGVVQLTKTLATAWAKDNIQVNCILPGWIETDLTRKAYKKMGLHEEVVARTPQGRWGTPDDLTGATIFLASKASNFITGSTLAVDGGFSALGGFFPR
jgi:2-dehydro-3-deoxy-D-gluconate 5-dehydrogenase